VIKIIGVNVDKNIDSMYDFITNDSGYDLCKNMYYYDDIDHVRTCNFSNILSKEMTFTCPLTDDKNFYDIWRTGANYMDGGFILKNSFDLSNYQLDPKYMNLLSRFIQCEDYSTIYNMSGNIHVMESKIDKIKDSSNNNCRGPCILTICKVVNHKHLLLKNEDSINSDYDFALLLKDKN
jgi:hypothetical protein